MTDTPDDFWGLPISTYSDREALEDGMLIAISPKDRVTRAAWDFIAANAPMGSAPPCEWPVDLATWFAAPAISQDDALKMIAKYGQEANAKLCDLIRERKAAALTIGIVGRESETARRIYENNEGGGIHTLNVAVASDDEILGLLPRPLTGGTVTMWLIPNELGGITLMLPEDY